MYRALNDTSSDPDDPDSDISEVPIHVSNPNYDHYYTRSTRTHTPAPAPTDIEIDAEVVEIQTAATTAGVGSSSSKSSSRCSKSSRSSILSVISRICGSGNTSDDDEESEIEPPKKKKVERNHSILNFFKPKSKQTHSSDAGLNDQQPQPSTSKSTSTTTITIESTSTSIQTKRKTIKRKKNDIEEKEDRKLMKKSYKQKYRKEWEKVFDWIQPSSRRPTYFHCKVCDKHLSGNFVAAARHSQTQAHITALRDFEPKDTMDLFEKTKHYATIQNQAKYSEIMVSLYVCQTDTPISHVDTLIPTIKKMDIESKVINQVKLGRTKCTALITRVIGATVLENMISILKVTQFSLMIDESTDRGTIKHLAVVVRYVTVHGREYRTIDAFLTLLQVTDGTHNGLYTILTKFFDDNKIPWRKNMIGFASDGANVMMGPKQSVQKLLTNEIPTLFVIKCVCHSLALCASYATKEIPDFVEHVVRDAYNYLKNSEKRTSQFASLQRILEVDMHKLLQLSDTRWLAVRDCTRRFIEQYDVLLAFFSSESGNAKNKDAKSIHDVLNNPFTKIYLYFLDYVLPIVVNVNERFQAEKCKIYELYDAVDTMFLTICQFFLKEEYVSSHQTCDLQFALPEHFLKIEDVYLGPVATSELELLTYKPAAKVALRTKCLNFYVQLCKEIRKRFPLDQMKPLKYVKFLNPCEFKTTKSISAAATLFHFNADCNDPKQNAVEIDREYRLLRNKFKSNTEVDPFKFWYKVKETQRYPLVIRLVEFILALPHSSAACERVFSKINNNKTAKRNRLETDTLKGILYGKTFLHIESKNCFEIEADLRQFLPKHTADIYEMS